MHVAILCEFGTVNGGENSLLAAVDRLPHMEFTWITPPHGRLRSRLDERGLRHVPLPPFSTRDHRLPSGEIVDRLQETVEGLAPTLLHANSLSMGRWAGLLAPRLNLPTTAHLRDILRLNRATVTALNANRALFAVSQATRDFHIRQGVLPERTHVLYNGIDTGLFEAAVSRGSLHRELGLPAEVRLIATIGQISLRKGQDVFVQAAVQAADALPDVHWLIVGERYSAKPESVAYEHDLREQIRQAGLTQRIHWLGYREPMPQLLAEIDLLVHPARQEPLGRVLLEACAAGVPVIATRVGGTAEIFEHGRSGLLLPPDDPQQLARETVALMQDAGRRAALAGEAQQAIARRFRIEDRAAELAAHWRRLSGE